MKIKTKQTKEWEIFCFLKLAPFGNLPESAPATANRQSFLAIAPLL